MIYTIINLIIFIMLNLFIFYKKAHFRNILAFIFFIIILSQIISIIEVGFYLPAIALTNLDNFKDIGLKPYFLAIFLFLIFLISSFFIKKINKKAISNLCLALMIFSSFFYKNSPIFCFSDVLFSALKESIFLSSFKLSKEKEKSILKSITKKKIVFDSNVSEFIEPKKYNVILFFIESLSRAPLKVMPNVREFLKKSIDVRNYYNHTFATVRGLRGQLNSFYQLSGGANKAGLGVTQLSKEKIKSKFNKKLISLVDILKLNGYHTYFESSQDENLNFSTYTKTFGFDKYFFLNDFKGIKSPSFKKESLSDKDSFLLLMQNLPNLKQPFFYAFYSFETHTKVNSKTINKFSDENLNKFYAFDYYFGKFFDWFKNTSLKENTILILSADHAHYPDSSYNSAFSDANKKVIDKVVFGIYKFGNKASIFDAKNLNSLSLAPTICDILGIKEGQNRFLGRSIFDKNQTIENKISAVGASEFYDLRDGAKKMDKKKYKNLIDKIISYEIIGG